MANRNFVCSLRSFAESTVLICMILGFIGHHVVLANDTFVAANIDPDNPNTCFNDDESQSLAVGEKQYLDDNCQYVQCIMMDGQLYWESRTCDNLYVPADCTTTQDMSGIFPECCPQLSCSNVMD